jgi:hypothetical protein
MDTRFAKVKIGENGNCVQYGLSIMRRALGFPTSIPEGEEQTDLRHFTTLATSLSVWFPGREIEMWVDPLSYLEASLLNQEAMAHVRYRGSDFVYEAEPEGLYGYGFGGVLDEHGNVLGHFVVGLPAAPALQTVAFVIKVSV